MADPSRMPQVNVDVTEAVGKKLAQLERQLSAENAHKREIVAVLIEKAKASDIPGPALRKYRTKFLAERNRRAKAQDSVDCRPATPVTLRPNGERDPRSNGGR